MKPNKDKLCMWPDANKFLIFLPLLLQLLGDVIGTSDDITNIWYFGCRWFGGSTNMLSCNCTPEAEEMDIQRYSIPGFDTSIIQLHNCAKVRFGAYAVYDLRNLRTISLNNIQSLTFEPYSLQWVGYRDTSITQEERFDLSIPSLKISVKDSTVESIGSYSFTGRINEISFENVRVENVEAFAFSSLLQMENLLFTNVWLKEIKPQAFKKFGTEFLTLDGVVADYLPSRTFSNVTVYRTFTIRNCRFHTLRPGTFIINNPTAFAVTNTEIHQLEGEAFLLSTTGDVLFRNNIFNNVQDHAFMGITLNGNEVTSSRAINFDANTFGRLDRRALDVRPQFQARVSNLNLNQTCDCENIVEKLRQSEFYNEISCLDADQYVTVRDFKAQNCSILSGHYTTVIIVCVLILVISIVAIAFYVYYAMVYKRQKYGCGKGGKPPLSLIVPDGRTYKETELHVIVEKADLLTTDL
ncbi:uncharacterized protein LOC109543314 [Dendroctonus ponderosae]|nr:uncharacterized protein LOC109543314 [Dendroctonus ponderosae]XP_019768525.2 uncharacterized protein LOC109543314 [Dendroctonus ponderosae]KAH1008683.1 hypothetical protein HUJ05_009218 [Dendroctonus ponderosae]